MMKKLIHRWLNRLGGMVDNVPSQSNPYPSDDTGHIRRIGNYELMRKLGDGAMGTVYLAKDTVTGQEVAVKTMALSEKFEADMESRFFREAEIIERLNHPNIVTVYDMGEEDGVAYISMELLQGSDLSCHTEPGNLLSYPVVLEIVACVADALDYAHKLDIVHRDVKPENIMYDRSNGTVKLMDFSVSRVTTEAKTKSGVVLGTPFYMSPEQLKGLKISGASDIFSLGVSLYQLLAGKLPFEGFSPMSVMSRITMDPHVDILTLRADLHPAVGKIVDKAMAKDIPQRFQSGAEMAEALRQCLSHIPY